MERILVTGATGFIGYEVARQLSERGAKPRLLVRRPFRGMILSRPNLYSVGAVRSWNLNLPVETNTLSKLLGLDPLYPTLHDGIPAVLGESISFRWRHSMKDHCLMDRLAIRMHLPKQAAHGPGEFGVLDVHHFRILMFPAYRPTVASSTHWSRTSTGASPKAWSASMGQTNSFPAASLTLTYT